MENNTAQGLTQFGQFMLNIIGTSDFGFFGALVVFALIGHGIRFTQEVSKRDKASPATPEPFSFKFLLIDNWKRIVNTLLMIFVCLRFYPVLITMLPEAAQGYFNSLSSVAPMAIGLVIGYGVDWISGYMKSKFESLQVDREKVMQKI